MSAVATLRLLVVASFVLAAFGAFVDIALPSTIPAELQAAYDRTIEAESAGSMLAALALGAIVLLLLLAGSVGLLLLKSWGRLLSVLSTVLGLPLYPMLGTVVQSGWAGLLVYCSALAWGAALSMAYCPPLSTRFAGQS